MNASIAPCAAHSISQQAEASIGTGRCRGYSAAVLTSSRHPTPVFTPGTLFSAAALLDCCVSAPGLRQSRRLFVTVDVFFFLIAREEFAARPAGEGRPDPLRLTRHNTAHPPCSWGGGAFGGPAALRQLLPCLVCGLVACRQDLRRHHLQQWQGAADGGSGRRHDQQNWPRICGRYWCQSRNRAHRCQCTGRPRLSRRCCQSQGS